MGYQGALAEELGKGLQNPPHRCESGTRLQMNLENGLRKLVIKSGSNPFDEGRVVELVYTTDLKSVAARLVGSSPTSPTILR